MKPFEKRFLTKLFMIKNVKSKRLLQEEKRIKKKEETQKKKRKLKKRYLLLKKSKIKLKKISWKSRSKLNKKSKKHKLIVHLIKRASRIKRLVNKFRISLKNKQKIVYKKKLKAFSRMVFISVKKKDKATEKTLIKTFTLC